MKESSIFRFFLNQQRIGFDFEILTSALYLLKDFFIYLEMIFEMFF